MSSDRKLPPGITIYRGKYRVRVGYKGQRVNLGTFQTVTQAKEARAIAQSDIARGIFLTPQERQAREIAAAEAAKIEDERKAYTVDALFRDWIEAKKTKLKRGSIATHESRYKANVQPDLGHYSVTEVTRREIQEWYEALHRDKGPGVSPNALTLVKALFQFATGRAKGVPADYEPVISESPAAFIENYPDEPVRPADRRQVATPEEVAGIAALMPEHTRLIVLLGAWTGMRMGEILGLRKNDYYAAEVDGERRHFLKIQRQVQGKDGLYFDTPKSERSKRTVPLPAPLDDLWERHVLAWAGFAHDGLVFPRYEHGNTPHNPNTVGKQFKRALEKWNGMQLDRQAPTLDHFRFHDLRHTALSGAGQMGATDAELMKYGGHSDARTVQVYQHATLNRLSDLAARMSENLVLPPTSDGGKVTPINAKERTA